MDETPNLGLPYIMAAQSQKHVTHNEAIRALDALVQLSVLDRSLSTPPASPAEGARYIVAASPTGAWSGYAGRIAAYQDGAWMFYVPHEGWIAWIANEEVAVVWTGSAWSALTTGGGGDPEPNPVFETVAINGATADSTNRLSLNAPATLLNHDGAGHQLKINKAAAGDTASTLYQTGFSGRAEMGLTGDDDFHFKVSPDGATWNEAIVIDKDTGEVTFPNTSLGGGSGAPADAEYIVKSASSGLSAERVLTDTATIAWDYATGGQAKGNVPNDAITYAKLQNVSATNKLLGRATAGAGDVEEIACTAFARSVLDDADAATARTTLGVAIGTNVQAYSANLATYAGIAPASNVQSLLGAANYAAMRGLLDLEAGTDFYSKSAADAAFQPLDGDLTAIAALTTTAAGRSILAYADPNADRLIYWNDGAGAFGSVTVGSGLSLSSGTLTATGGGGGGGREVLTGNRTYYVRTNGSDSNNGRANTSGGAFLTLQKAIDVATALDLGIYKVTISVADGTYTGGVTAKSYIGAGPIEIIGNIATPANVFINCTNADCFNFSSVLGKYVVSGFKVRTTTGGWTFLVGGGSVVDMGKMVFDACAYDRHISIMDGSSATAIDNWEIVAGTGQSHISVTRQSRFICAGRTVTLTGTPGFPTAFVSSGDSSTVIAYSMTFSGSATGPRYLAQNCASIVTLGGGANYFPGNSAGSGSNPGAAPYGIYS